MEDLLIKKEYAECYDIGPKDDPNTNELRFYCWQWPDAYTLQIRTHKPINGCMGRGKPRNMIAHCHITEDDLRAMLDYIEKTKHRHD